MIFENSNTIFDEHAEFWIILWTGFSQTVPTTPFAFITFSSWNFSSIFNDIYFLKIIFIWTQSGKLPTEQLVLERLNEFSILTGIKMKPNINPGLLRFEILNKIKHCYSNSVFLRFFANICHYPIFLWSQFSNYNNEPYCHFKRKIK